MSLSEEYTQKYLKIHKNKYFENVEKIKNM